MVKHLRKRTKRHNKKHKRQSKKMYGGDFTNMDKNELLNLGFNNDDILLLETYIPNMNLIRISLQQINPETGVSYTPEELMQSLHENVDENLNEDEDDNEDLNVSRISNISNDSHELDNFDTSFISNEDSMNTTNDNSNYLNDNYDNNYSLPLDDNSLHLSDLNDNNSSTNTTREEYSFGGKKRQSLKKYMGKKKYKGIKKNKSNKKHRKIQKGGICYGRGVGANNYDPNFSIYNTRELQLFPYRPTPTK
jgi:hypothetical protein